MAEHKYQAGDEVTHAGKRWQVVWQSGGIVRITNGMERKEVRAQLVKPLESKR